MVGRTDLDTHASGEFCREAEAGTEDFQDERIAGAHQFHAAAHADAERLEAQRILVVRGDLAHHGANARGEFIQAHEWRGLFSGCHNGERIKLNCWKVKPAVWRRFAICWRSFATGFARLKTRHGCGNLWP